MRYQILLLLVVTVVCMGFLAPTASADLASSLARMDAIIKEMQALRAEFASLTTAAPTTPTGSVLGASTKSFFTQSLEVGETNSDIKKIQKLLATDPEIYPYGVASGFYGPKTEEGIRNFQSRFGMDPVGVVGPATKSLLELFFAAYPDDVYPADVLKKKPTVLGVATSQPLLPAVATTPSTNTSNPASTITAYLEDGEADVRIKYKNGEKDIFLIEGEDMDEVVEGIVDETELTTAQILAIIKFTDADKRNDDDDDDDDEDEVDEEDAQDALDDAEDAIDQVQEDIDDADGEVDTDDAEEELEEAEDLLDEAQDAFDDEDYDDAKDLAEEAEEKADDAAQELEDAEDAV